MSKVEDASKGQDKPARDVTDPVVTEAGIFKFTGDHVERILAEDPRRHLIFDYPTVYICAFDEGRRPQSFIAYVGETNNIKARTSQHLKDDPKTREDWAEFSRQAKKNRESVRQYVIGHEHFNKSLTLDIENRMIHYLLGVDSVRTLNNRRTNPQGNYYTHDELEEIFSRAWAKLHVQNNKLFPNEKLIRDSALFKASPFHELSKGQLAAERQILAAIDAAMGASSNSLEMGAYGKLIVVEGAAGTGKTVVLSHLFNTLMAKSTDGEDDEERQADKPLDAYLLVSHDEQRKVYNQIAIKLGLQKKEDEVVLSPVPFLNRYSNTKATKSGNGTTHDHSSPSGRVDVALIDEAHLLDTQSGQAYQGKSVLLDVMRRAKVTIAVFDPGQILKTAQRWDEDDLAALLGDGRSTRHDSFDKVKMSAGATIDRMAVVLKDQFRIAASKELIAWIDDLIDGKGIGPIPKSDEYYLDGKLIKDPYELRVFSSPVELFEAIREKALNGEGRGLSRVLATYDWGFSESRACPDEPQGLWDVRMHLDASGEWVMGLAEGDDRGYIAGDDDPTRFCHPWNYGLSPKGASSITGDAWAEREATLEEIGSTFTIQGFDLNYAGVIIGPSVKLRNGKLVFDAAASKSKKATSKRGGKIDYSSANLRNELNVLLKRGVHGLYLFAVDPELRKALIQAASGNTGSTGTGE